jgi:hypothetical protein
VRGFKTTVLLENEAFAVVNRSFGTLQGSRSSFGRCSRSYCVTAAEIEQAYRAISRREGVRVLPATGAFVDEHREHAARWDLAPITAALGRAVRFHVIGSREDRFEGRQLHLARERLSDAVKSTELPGGHLATAEQPRRLADLIERLC